jgi:hypothetical protein
MRLPRTAAVLAMLGALALPAVPAIADGDPASDFLLVQDAFFPYAPVPAANLRSALDTTVAMSKAAGYPIKVALIESPNDLGAVPNLFNQPQRYADFLDSEIAFNGTPKLLVVMPQGFGTSHTLPASILAGIPIDQATQSNGLVRAAIAAVARLAARAGHPFTPPPIPRVSSGASNSTPALAFIAPIALVVLAAVTVTLVMRRRERAETGGK